MTFARSAFFGLSVLLLSASAGWGESPYYGFYPSSASSHFKRLEHNILGFSIDMPSSWTVGISGKPPFTVVIIYPDGMNTAKFTEDYESIEIGTIPMEIVSLETAAYYAMLGMRHKHPVQELLQDPERLTIQGNEALRWVYSWPSKAGHTIVENISLVSYGNSIRSIAIRATISRYAEKRDDYLRIVSTFQPLTTKY